ncbi:MarR family transcriptional regulator [Streptomyces sp. A1547]|uniref:MarR family winged helix-turn-helix transcriptional regulator n=1 Tax=Streptomyces sp. A1547 TaxID=2563105 RepID=UPI001F0FEC92|nr:MarR family transcriptional regulator [Streptomyces sp. A1547]
MDEVEAWFGEVVVRGRVDVGLPDLHAGVPGFVQQAGAPVEGDDTSPSGPAWSASLRLHRPRPVASRHQRCHDDIVSVDERAKYESPSGPQLYDVIRSLWPLHRTIVRAVERELMGTGMTAGQHAVMDELRRGGPRTVPQLARLLGLDRQPVQRLVNDATALGLAESTPNPEHQRSRLIRLTPKGEATIRGIQEAEETELRRRLPRRHEDATRNQTTNSTCVAV